LEQFVKITKILFADYNRALIRTWKIMRYCKSLYQV